MPVTLPTTIDTSYADNGTDASVKLHQQHHDNLHGRFNQIVHADDPGNSVPQNGSSDCLSSLGALVAAAPNVGVDPVTIIRLGSKPYALSALLDTTGKNVIIEGVPGYHNAGGVAGSRFIPLNNGITLFKNGTTTISHQGPQIRGVGFANPLGKTGIKAVYLHTTNRAWLEDCWFSDVDFGIHVDGAAGLDNAWHVMRALKFYHIGINRSTGGAAAIDLGNSYGAMWDDLEFLISNPTSGTNYGIISNDAAGASGHQFDKMMFDGVNSADNIMGIYLRYANHCHFNNAKMEQMGTGITVDGNMPTNGQAGRGLFFRGFSLTQMTNGLVIAAGAGDTTPGDGSGADDFSFESVTNPVVMNANANGFVLGEAMINAGYGKFKQDPDVTGGAPTTTPDSRYKAHYIALTANCTAVNAPTNPRKGNRLTLTFQQDGTGGRTLPAFNAAYKMPAVSNTGNTANKYWSGEFIYDGSVWIATNGSMFAATQWF